MPEGNHQKKEIIHGTSIGYRKGCRCKDCRKFHNERIKKWRNKIKQTAGSNPVTPTKSWKVA